MGVLTTAGKNALLNAIDGLGWHAALFNGEPGSGGTEQAAFSAARLAVDGALAAASGASVANDADLTWSATGANTVTWIGFLDSATAGNLVGKHQLSSARTLISGDSLSVPIGDATFALTDPA